MTLDKQREAFFKAVGEEKPYIPVTGELMHDLAGRVNVDVDRDEALAVRQTLPMIGKGRQKVTLSLVVAKFLASSAPAQPQAETKPPVVESPAPEVETTAPVIETSAVETDAKASKKK